ncbi:hypothetical protein [Hymenobacter antarcticus]|uniref:hypothetical protein n=1 Tax=Hymenobacter antarcticus TaxID=486270 RepID=UPI0031E787F5
MGTAKALLLRLFGENLTSATDFFWFFFRIDFALIGLYAELSSSSPRAALAAGLAGNAAFFVVRFNEIFQSAHHVPAHRQTGPPAG